MELIFFVIGPTGGAYNKEILLSGDWPTEELVKVSILSGLEQQQSLLSYPQRSRKPSKQRCVASAAQTASTKHFLENNIKFSAIQIPKMYCEAMKPVDGAK